MDRSEELEELLVLWRDTLPKIAHPHEFKRKLDNCPLCKNYKTPDTCAGCPVFIKTGQSRCKGVGQLFNVLKAHRNWALGQIGREEYQAAFPDLIAFIESLSEPDG